MDICYLFFACTSPLFYCSSSSDADGHVFDRLACLLVFWVGCFTDRRETDGGYRHDRMGMFVCDRLAMGNAP